MSDAFSSNGLNLMRKALVGFCAWEREYIQAKQYARYKRNQSGPFNAKGEEMATRSLVSSCQITTRVARRGLDSDTCVREFLLPLCQEKEVFASLG